ncbi:unnamed protein product [Protopolystoma xenopodis]|uniref:Uncharacterized protein n=1 Tax=Protopolystoma xenopodis TaxID=117903 RepID=A0A448XN49_9PLAT|nr:unnamed protein product [Protopolystoma xenopodis]
MATVQPSWTYRHWPSESESAHETELVEEVESGTRTKRTRMTTACQSPGLAPGVWRSRHDDEPIRQARATGLATPCPGRDGAPGLGQTPSPLAGPDLPTGLRNLGVSSQSLDQLSLAISLIVPTAFPIDRGSPSPSTPTPTSTQTVSQYPAAADSEPRQTGRASAPGLRTGVTCLPATFASSLLASLSPSPSPSPSLLPSLPAPLSGGWKASENCLKGGIAEESASIPLCIVLTFQSLSNLPMMVSGGLVCKMPQQQAQGNPSSVSDAANLRIPSTRLLKTK